MSKNNQNKSPLQIAWEKLKREAKKKAGQDVFLAIRIGDFYEFFNQDAKDVAALLGKALCKRGDALMCGIVYHEIYSAGKKLAATGEIIAIVEKDNPEKYTANEFIPWIITEWIK